MWSNNIDSKINVGIAQHTPALSVGLLSEGTRITPRTPRRSAIAPPHWLRRMGVTELVLICPLQQKRKGQNTPASVKTLIYTLLNWRVSLFSLGWLAAAAPELRPLPETQPSAHPAWGKSRICLPAGDTRSLLHAGKGKLDPRGQTAYANFII